MLKVRSAYLVPELEAAQRKEIEESYLEQYRLLAGKEPEAEKTAGVPANAVGYGPEGFITKPGAGAADFGSAPPGQNEGDTGTLPDGRKVIVRKGRIVLQ